MMWIFFPASFPSQGVQTPEKKRIAREKRVAVFLRQVLESPAYTLSSFRLEYWGKLRKVPAEVEQPDTPSLGEFLARQRMSPEEARLRLRERQRQEKLRRERQRIINQTLPIEFDVVVDKFGNFECSDPRDKIYGLQGLVDQNVEVDYTKTTEQVFSTSCITSCRRRRIILPLGETWLGRQ
jgi:hypothetical protein